MKEKKTITIDVDKIKNIVIVVLLLIIVLGGSFMVTEMKSSDTKTDANEETDSKVKSALDSSKAQQESAEIGEDEQKELEEIDLDRYLELKEGSDAVVIYIARPTCQFCQIQNPIIKNIAYEYDATFYYLNTDEMSAEDSSKLIKSDDSFEDGLGTPCTIVVKDDQIIAKAEGLTEKEKLVELFKNNGVDL